MVRRAGVVLLTLVGGCVSSDPALPLVGGDNPFNNPSEALKAFHDPAAEAVAVRVHQLGHRLLEANPDLPVRPAFQAIGSPQPELFHRGTTEVYVSQGLVNRCATDAELAAVLCVGLGRMMSEREAVSALRARRVERELPASLPIGADAGGSFGPADATHLAERAKFDNERRSRNAPPPPPDPLLLARNYLAKAGYAARDLENVQPLLKEAEKNSALEKTLTSTPVRPWLP